MNYPKFRMGKDIVVKMTPQVGVMECAYKHLVKAFGNPNLSTEYGDEFDGVEKVAWHIQFQTGHVVKVSDVRPFGTQETDYRNIRKWKVNAHDETIYEWIKQIIRDSNPNA